MDDCVDAVERSTNRVTVTHVSDLELDVEVEVVRPLPIRVDLAVERVERPHVVTVREQPVGEVRADETGAAGDQNAHGSA
jgi:hypothetical protein